MRWGHESLALTTSISATINFIILYFTMRKYAGDFGTGDLLALLAKLAAAGVAMAAVCLAANRYFFADPAQVPFWLRATGLMATAAIAAGVYFAAARVLKVNEAREALDLILRRFRR